MNKGGFLRILEAFVAVMIIGGVVGFLYFQKVSAPKQEDTANELLSLALKEISKNPDLRQAVLDGNENGVTTEIRKIIPAEYELKIRICSLSDICSLQENINKEIYSSEVSVSTTIDNVNDLNPKKARVFIWKK